MNKDTWKFTRGDLGKIMEISCYFVRSGKVGTLIKIM